MVCSNSSHEVKAISWFSWNQNDFGCGTGYSDTQMMEGERFQDDNRAIVNSNERVLDGGNAASLVEKVI